MLYKGSTGKLLTSCADASASRIVASNVGTRVGAFVAAESIPEGFEDSALLWVACCQTAVLCRPQINYGLQIHANFER